MPNCVSVEDSGPATINHVFAFSDHGTEGVSLCLETLKKDSGERDVPNGMQKWTGKVWGVRKHCCVKRLPLTWTFSILHEWCCTEQFEPIPRNAG